MKVTLTHVTENPIQAIEEAAANCYDSIPSPDGKIMKACYKSGHHSVLEFATFTFHIEGVSRALLAQLTRHRHAGYAVRSQRYCKEYDFGFYTPRTISNNPKAQEAYTETMKTLQATYDYLVDVCDIPAEDARMVLPNACETTLEFTCNGRELLHIMGLRLCTRAQEEIRTLCILMRAAVRDYNEECAKFSEFMVPKCQVDGFCTEHACCGMMPRLKDIMKVYQEHKINRTKQE